MPATHHAPPASPRAPEPLSGCGTWNLLLLFKLILCPTPRRVREDGGLGARQPHRGLPSWVFRHQAAWGFPAAGDGSGVWGQVASLGKAPGSPPAPVLRGGDRNCQDGRPPQQGLRALPMRPRGKDLPPPAHDVSGEASSLLSCGSAQRPVTRPGPAGSTVPARRAPGPAVPSPPAITSAWGRHRAAPRSSLVRARAVGGPGPQPPPRSRDSEAPPHPRR